ncbi:MULTISPECIES: hypothetical protein [unclassified Bradyrhizobium]|uniref:hypothetical protein n=1 Tax=unclassified Bradyrhizobium TaxID=2631580 RepID=UPI0028EC43C0|nr:MULTISPECIES: hypothetical protein [unclassified Bradyrhizobium]
MPKPYVPPHPFVEVIWDDASSKTEWVPPADAGGLERVLTRGFLVKEDNRMIAIAGSVAGEQVEVETVGDVISIPKGMIVARRELVVAAKRARKGERANG